MLLDTLGSYVTGTTYDDAGRVTARALGNGLEQEFPSLGLGLPTRPSP